MKKMIAVSVIFATLVLNAIWLDSARENDGHTANMSETEPEQEIGGKSENESVPEILPEEEPGTEDTDDLIGYREDSLAGIKYLIPSDWYRQPDSSEGLAGAYYYPTVSYKGHDYFFDAYYVPVEKFSVEDVHGAMLEYYVRCREKDGFDTGDLRLEDCNGIAVIRFSIFDKEYARENDCCVFPVHEEGILIVSYTIEEGAEDIYRKQFDTVLCHVEIPDEQTVREALPLELEMQQ